MKLQTPAQRRGRALRFMATPMVRWHATINRMNTSDRMALTDTLAAFAQTATRASAYVSRRHTGGRHIEAVKAQNQACRKVRQALGYTYADDQVTF